MIPVQLAAEPQKFDKLVRKKGLKWLKKMNIKLDAAVPQKTKVYPFWQACTKELWEAYAGICAYYAIYIEFAIGAASTDHLVAKSKLAAQIYEWDNYRLACLGANRNKNKYDDVLDPIGLKPETFYINFISGAIFPNPALSPEENALALKTIKRLGLDRKEIEKMRKEHFTYYIKGDWSANFLHKQSPFVYSEMERQSLL